MKKFLIISCAVLFLGNCAPQTFRVDPSYWDNPTTIGVVISKIPPAFPHKEGAYQLLDYVINAVTMYPLKKHLETLELDMQDTSKNFVEKLNLLGFKAKIIDETIDIKKLPNIKSKKRFAKKDFSSLREKYDIEQLLTINVLDWGTNQSYYAFIPTSNPRGYFTIQGRILDLNSNKVLWLNRKRADLEISDDWDQEKEGYPNLTNTVYQAVEEGKKAIVDKLFETVDTVSE